MSPPACQLGYCTNVHAGANLAQYWDHLRRHAVAVKERFSPQSPMGIGLWFSETAARELAHDRLPEFRDWLREQGLVPFTFNGFPQGDFHDTIVKHRVYQPTWLSAERLAYTELLVDIQHQLLPPDYEGSISTLPIAWGTPALSADELQLAAKHLRAAAHVMHSLEERTGRLIHLALEPEPGCVFTYAADIIEFFEQYLLAGLSATAADIVRRHIRICHDVCHAAVMFEEQRDVLRRYQAAGIRIGKFQISAAVRLALDEFPPCSSERSAAIAQLAEFQEPRYLHQTVVRRGTERTYYEDLPQALAAEADVAVGEWRVHFHVPIFLERFGRLHATQEQIDDCLSAVADGLTDCRHFEVETYAWGVLPEELRRPDLADGIAAEMSWLDERLRSLRLR